MLIIAALAAAPAAALAQSPGDDQYTDPFGSNTTTSGSPTSTTDMPPELSQTPEGTSDDGGSSAGTTSTAAPAPTKAGELPATGLDARGVALGGLALLLMGIGLRMRLDADPRG